MIGYDKASKIAHYALDNDLTLKEAALKLGFVTEAEFDRVVDPKKMVKPYVATRCRLGRGPSMTLEGRADLVLAVAKVLFVNGQSTEQTLAAAERLGNVLGVRECILPRWGELQLEIQDSDARVISAVAADPTNVAMGRVASAMRVIEELSAGQ